MPQKGFVNAALLLALAIIGLLAYVVITTNFPFKNYLFQVFYSITSQADIGIPPSTVEMKIAGNSDVANEVDGKLEPAKKNNTHWIGNASSRFGSYLGLRFTGAAIPDNAEITSAYLKVMSSQTTWEVLNLAIYADKDTQSPSFTSSSLPSLRVKVPFAQNISLDEKWFLNKTYKLDVTTPVKGLLKEGGNKGIITLIIQGAGKPWDYYFFYDNRLPSRAPTLTVNYTLAPTGTPTPTPTLIGSGSTPTPTPNQNSTPTPSSAPVGEIWKPSINVSWQWMIDHALDINNKKDMGLTDPQGNLLSTPEPQIYDIDGFYNGQDPNCNIKDKNGVCVQGENDVVKQLHNMGKKVICYIDAGVYENYRPDAYKFPSEVIGSPDAGWSGSYWLDIRRTDILGPIMKARMQMCKDKGYDAIEPDEIDGFSNDTKFGMTYQDQVNYNKFITQMAHDLGMSIGLKGDINQVKDLWPYFDWTLNEECYQYNECDLLKPFSNNGKAVFQVEYKTATSNFCSNANTNNWNAMKMPLSLNGGRWPCR